MRDAKSRIGTGLQIFTFSFVVHTARVFVILICFRCVYVENVSLPSSMCPFQWNPLLPVLSNKNKKHLSKVNLTAICEPIV
jgi:hypothetical protein